MGTDSLSSVPPIAVRINNVHIDREVPNNLLLIHFDMCIASGKRFVERAKENEEKKELVSIFIEEKDLSPIQKANMEMSLAWKTASYELIMNAWKEKDKDGKRKLEDAIIWCGEKGHAISRISKTDRDTIVSRLIDALKKEMPLISSCLINNWRIAVFVDVTKSTTVGFPRFAIF